MKQMFGVRVNLNHFMLRIILRPRVIIIILEVAIFVMAVIIVVQSGGAPRVFARYSAHTGPRDARRLQGHDPTFRSPVHAFLLTFFDVPGLCSRLDTAATECLQHRTVWELITAHLLHCGHLPLGRSDAWPTRSACGGGGGGRCCRGDPPCGVYAVSHREGAIGRLQMGVQ